MEWDNNGILEEANLEKEGGHFLEANFIALKRILVRRNIWVYVV